MTEMQRNLRSDSSSSYKIVVRNSGEVTDLVANDSRCTVLINRVNVKNEEDFDKWLEKNKLMRKDISQFFFK